MGFPVSCPAWFSARKQSQFSIRKATSTDYANQWCGGVYGSDLSHNFFFNISQHIII